MSFSGFKASFYIFNKKINSTKRPEAGEYNEWKTEVLLDNNTPRDSPIIFINGYLSGRGSRKYFPYNYVIIDGLGYYWIDNIDFKLGGENLAAIGKVTVQCSRDILAEVRDDLKYQTAYVEYSKIESGEYIDSRVKYIQRQNIDFLTIGKIKDTGAGCVLLQYATDHPTYAGSGIVLVTYAELREILQNIAKIDDTVLDSITKSYGKPNECLLSAKILPFDIAEIYEPVPVYIGTYKAGTGHRISSPVAGNTIMVDGAELSFKLPQKLRIMGYNEKTNGEQVTISIYLPYYGIVNLNYDILRNLPGQEIDIDVALDVINGTITYYLDKLGEKYTATVGMYIPLSVLSASATADVLGKGFTAVANLAGMPKQSEDGTRTLGGFVQNITQPFLRVQAVGSLGGSGWDGYLNPWAKYASDASGAKNKNGAVVVRIIDNTLEEAQTRQADFHQFFGYVTKQTRGLIDVWDGYVQTLNFVYYPHLDYGITQRQIEEVQDLLNGGVYLE